MAKNSMFDKKVISVVLMLIGIGLAYWGYQMSESITSQLSQAFSGSASDGVIIRYIGGAISFAFGLYLFKSK